MEEATEPKNETVIGAEWLCGPEDDFWNSTSSWNAERPLVGPCFQSVMWTFPPVVLFWAVLPFSVWFSVGRWRRDSRRGLRPHRWTPLMLAKITVMTGLAVIAIWDLVTAVIESTSTSPLIQLVESCLRLLTVMASVAAVLAHNRLCVVSSGLMWSFWGVYSFTSVLVAAHYLTNMHNPSIQLPVLNGAPSFFTSAALITLSYLITFWADTPAAQAQEGYQPPKDQSNPSPKSNSSFASKLTFAWFTDMAWRGFRRDLTMEEIWDLEPSSTCAEVHRSFEANFHKKKPKKVVYVSADGDDNRNGMAGDTMEMGETGARLTSDHQQQQQQQPVSIVPALLRTFGFAFLSGSILKCLQDILTFAPPIFLKLIIAFVESGPSASLWKGVLYCLLLLAVISTQTLLLSQYFYKMYLIGLQVRSALTAAIYKKSLVISLSSNADSSTGEIVNLMSVDIQRIVDMMPYFNMVWSAPFQIIAATYFLWQELGASVLAGLLTMVILIPFNGFIAAKSRTFQIAQMKEKDKRVKQMNEILQGIKILKLYAWEPSFQDQVNDIRHREIGILRKMGFLQAGTSFMWTCAPFLVSLVSFATYVLVDESHVLDSKKAFVSLTLFNILRFPLSMMPMVITSLVQANVATKRINKFMNSEEAKMEVDRLDSEDGKDSIKIQNGTFKWSDAPKKEEKEAKKDDKIIKENGKEEEKVALNASPEDLSKPKEPTLKDISLSIKKGSLVAVVGPVGAGKSSLLSALLGETEKLSGSVQVRGTVSYVPQQAWIQNATVKDNVLFGAACDEARYLRVIRNAALEDDLDMLPAGDATEIGEKGINLSGGQKQRISLARALYAETDIYLLDDPLSAVDAHVGKALFERAVGPNGCLAGKTRVLVTHGMTFLPQVDLIVVLSQGKISEVGHYKELLERKGEFAELMIQYISDHAEEVAEVDELGDLKKTMEECMGRAELERQISRHRTVSTCVSDSGDHAKERALSESQLSDDREKTLSNENLKKNMENGGPQKKQPNGKQQYQEEKVETGTVSYKVFLYYIRSMGVLLSAAMAFFYTLGHVFTTLSSVWLSKWSDDHDGDRTDLYLGVYGLLGLGQMVSAVAASVCLFLAALGGAERLHGETLKTVLRAPMSFFDTTPQGRLLNRFGKDVDVLDSTMPMIIRGWMTCFLGVVSTFVIIIYTTPIFAVPLTIILACYYFVQRIYVATSRQLKRLESVTRSPIYSHFGETLSGIQTIRAFSAQDKAFLESQRRVDHNMKSYWPGIVANRWLAVRLEMVGNLIIFCSALFAVMSKDSITSGLVGLSVSYALSVTQTLNWLVRMTSELETNIVAVERLKEYVEIDSEAEWRNEGSDAVPRDWPSEGKVEFDNYSTRYREGLPLALRDVSFTAPGGQRVGIVGRTGAGKSSLTMALFRLIEPAGGRIMIDGVDSSTLGLHDLRSKLSIIPQDPVLFSGTLRMNLDPFQEYTDEQVETSLKQAHLGEFLRQSGLDYAVQEGGNNLSMGQRQLVCLARALLRRSRILVLDEATAAVDVETDEIIQQTIREQFSTSTILTIAHRLNTIMDYHKIVVLSAGTIVEFDTRENLLADKNSAFYSMCKEAKLVE